MSRRALVPIAAVVATLALAACGGGGDGGSQASTGTGTGAEAPSNTQATASPLMALVRAMIGDSSDTSEPIGLGMVTPDATDSGEPEVL